MTNTPTLPEDPSEKRLYLERAWHHGEALQPLLAIGAPLQPLLDHLGASSDLSTTRVETGLVIRFGELVAWDVTLDEAGRIAGYGATGYRPLMAALGIDFGGQPYVDND